MFQKISSVSKTRVNYARKERNLLRFEGKHRDVIQRERNRWNIAQKQCGLNNESYRNALQAFIDRRRFSDDLQIDTPASPDKTRRDLLTKTNNNKCDNERKAQKSKSIVPSVPHIPASEIFEIGWVPGTEDRYVELIFAEWQNTRVSLKRHTHPECKDAVKADLDVLLEIQHPNVLLLMAVTHTDEHGLVSIFEPVDCTLYHYIHEQGERISIQDIAKCGGRLSDALRHCHMRGYVHSAISSHCVYLASSGIVKLGGWELAMQIGSPIPDREHEERLRTEVFRWQAPELFHSYEPRKESDVYGLAMLIWEMCTMHVPWRGYSKVDVDKQYVHWKRGVIVDLYNFPPLLNNLLEAGLQLDVGKRTLDMNRMCRFLQRLEIQYEDEEPVYVDQYANNNNENGKTYVLPATKSPMAVSRSKESKLTKSTSAKQLSYSTRNAKFSTYSKRSAFKQTENVKAAAHIEQMNFFVGNVKRKTRNDVQKNTNIFSSVQNNCRKSSCSNCNSEVSEPVQSETDFEDNLEEALQPWHCSYQKVWSPCENVESKTSSIYSSPLLESTDDESFKDARSNLKQLKKVLANKRQRFFYGSDLQKSTDTSPSTKSVEFDQVKSKNYEPHKPASHKTSLEPKLNKSFGQYDPSCMKSTLQQCHKTPYQHTPESIKAAIMQPQTLNSDPLNFFETSLWRKEKLICLSKMRKPCNDETVDYVLQPTDENNTVSTSIFSKNEMEVNSSRSDNTYILNKEVQETSQETSMQVSERISDSVETSPRSKPLQVLKDALDRATKIVRSLTPNLDESCLSPPFEYKDFEITSDDDSQTSKKIFENLYNIQANDGNDEIKSIERSTKKNQTLLFSKDNVIFKTTNSNQLQMESENDATISLTNYENPNHSYSRNFVCESIAEVSSEFINNSCTDTNSVKGTKLLSDQKTTIEEQKKPLKTIECIIASVEQNDTEIQVEIEENKKMSEPTNFNLMFLNDSSKTKNCKSCHPCALPRRRSLPAALSQLRLVNSSALGRLPIRRGDVPDNTVEDLYIDDEFGDSLNVNMVLLDEDLSFDEDFLPDLSEL
ncbi:uncharacterized protein LOC143154996 isoform X2 [Ptiloglossa arizonensis]|uniref:uncharacterized protein LOC143154996 isoform X2 n=1 Tax=Ptiloglossa arizonensis TaxID=3350558 RepID=UPI003F9EBA92